jgi:hypothetical protein
MNTKKLAIFGASALVLAGVLVYALGIYPPASGRDGRGAIGQRDVYHAEQPADASVNPNDAPIATADQLKNGDVVTLQNGEMFQFSNGFRYQVQSGQLRPVQDGITYQLATGQMVQFRNNMLYQMNNGAIVRQLSTGEFVRNMSLNQMFALQNGVMFKMLSNGQIQRLGMNASQMNADHMQMNMNSNNIQSSK